MAAIAVVREKETGSIASFQSTPITKFEFLFGKELPISRSPMISFVLLGPAALARSSACRSRARTAMLVLGTLLYVIATTALRPADLDLHPGPR